MQLDNWLVVVILGGVVMSCIYIVAEYLSWRAWHASEFRERSSLSNLYKRFPSAVKNSPTSMGS